MFNIFKFFRKKTFAAKIGEKGERAATKHLARTMKILERNFRSGKREIDIIALHNDCLVFVEVKTRNSSALVDGYFCAMNKNKRAAVRACARDYMKKYPRKYTFWRFDVIEVKHDDNGNIVDLNHYENVAY